MKLIDTHTHFDVDEFDHDRILLAQQARQRGVEKLVLIGLTANRFHDLQRTHQVLTELYVNQASPQSILAPGLHPMYIEHHQPEHLQQLEVFLQQFDCKAVGEIGLDRFLPAHKTEIIQQRQQYYFLEQLALAQHYQLPVLLHIRKAHAEVLKLLKAQRFMLGGIAHAFSGGVEEAKAFIRLGFKLGITGQISNPNAKKLRQVVQAVGVEHLVIETDCPDMTPLCCQTSQEVRTRNTPANLPCVLRALSEVLQIDEPVLAERLWANSLQALHLLEE